MYRPRDVPGVTVRAEDGSLTDWAVSLCQELSFEGERADSKIGVTPSAVAGAVVYLALWKLVISFNDAFFAVTLLEPRENGIALERVEWR